jgi:hypothetical protein
MKRLLLAALIAALPAATWADDFNVGDRVTVGSTGDTGTIIAVSQKLADGGYLVKVHLDKLGDGFPNVGATYDTAMSHVTVSGKGAPPPAGPPPGGAAPRPGAGIGGAPGGAGQPPPQQINPATQTSASPALCQQLIRGNYPPTGADQTISVNFLSFQMGGAQSYEAVYANDENGRGHTVTAWPVHAKYTVLTHFDDPQADDQLRTYDAQYMCYKSPVGGWVVEMTSRLPGGETAQYIHKG